jgi:xanthosine utilization system XapX-like protein
MKKFLFSWFAGMLVILIFCFFVIGVPTLIGFIGLPDWVVFAYLFIFASIVFGLTGMKD